MKGWRLARTLSSFLLFLAAAVDLLCGHGLLLILRILGVFRLLLLGFFLRCLRGCIAHDRLAFRVEVLNYAATVSLLEGLVKARPRPIWHV